LETLFLIDGNSVTMFLFRKRHSQPYRESGPAKVAIVAQLVRLKLTALICAGALGGF